MSLNRDLFHFWRGRLPELFLHAGMGDEAVSVSCSVHWMGLQGAFGDIAADTLISVP